MIIVSIIRYSKKWVQVPLMVEGSGSIFVALNGSKTIHLDDTSASVKQIKTCLSICVLLRVMRTVPI